MNKANVSMIVEANQTMIGSEYEGSLEIDGKRVRFLLKFRQSLQTISQKKILDPIFTQNRVQLTIIDSKKGDIMMPPGTRHFIIAAVAPLCYSIFYRSLTLRREESYEDDDFPPEVTTSSNNRATYTCNFTPEVADFLAALL